MRLLTLPTVLRSAGLVVREEPGWLTRGSEQWGPVRGLICHATAGARGGSSANEIRVLINGSPSAPPPIAQLYLGRDGVWHVVASGRCNHALIGWGGPCQGLGNSQLLGVEAGNDNRGEPWPAVQLSSYRRGVAILCSHYGIPVSRVAGHYEHQPGDKSDPLGINMTTFRAEVTRINQSPPPPQGGLDMLARCSQGDKSEAVGTLQRMLRAAGYDPGPIDDTYGPLTASAVSKMRSEANRRVGFGTGNGQNFGPASYVQLQTMLAVRHNPPPPVTPPPAGGGLTPPVRVTITGVMDTA